MNYDEKDLYYNTTPILLGLVFTGTGYMFSGTRRLFINV